MIAGYRAERRTHISSVSTTGGLVSHGADAPWLDSCDEHRNEVEGGDALLPN
ncbi:hypothetical protein GGE07_002391 [Sinorhizobium terangae]|nr:hypothetical protein [Sinorhizobium terangae]